MSTRLAVCALLAATLGTHGSSQSPAAVAPPFLLTACGAAAGARCGRFEVFENRATRAGRRIPINVVVLPAQSATPAPDPIFVFAGGPGQSAASLARAMASSWQRATRDIVLVDQRGTGASNPLQCALPGSDADLQGYFEPVYDRQQFRRCREALGLVADVAQYGSLAAIDDIEEIRQALGYGRINAAGGSGGTRTILLYMRRYPGALRTAILTGLAPPAFRNPLHHARSAQEALDLLMQACHDEAACREAFPNLRQEFAALLSRLDRTPATVALPRDGGGSTEVVLTRAAFVDAVRVLMYSTGSARQLPWLIHQAHDDDFAPIAQRGLAAIRGQRQSTAMGLLMTVVCGEDVPRIRPGDIDAETRGTFLGDGRVRQQMGACEEWPRAPLAPGYGDPVVSDVPTLVLSGRYDPVTPPRWGDETARHLKNAVHLMLPGGHGGATPCTDAIARKFLDAGTTRGLDTSCVADLRLPPFVTGR